MLGGTSAGAPSRGGRGLLLQFFKPVQYDVQVGHGLLLDRLEHQEPLAVRDTS